MLDTIMCETPPLISNRRLFAGAEPQSFYLTIVTVVSTRKDTVQTELANVLLDEVEMFLSVVVFLF